MALVAARFNEFTPQFIGILHEERDDLKCLGKPISDPKIKHKGEFVGMSSIEYEAFESSFQQDKGCIVEKNSFSDKETIETLKIFPADARKDSG